MLASSGTVVVTAWQGEEERVREAWWVAGDRDTKGGGEVKRVKLCASPWSSSLSTDGKGLGERKDEEKKERTKEEGGCDKHLLPFKATRARNKKSSKEEHAKT